ncbi:MAG TPA: penicillin-binding protein activator LpoB [Pirellulales bacterium]|nr:penicillin-binding protein activator LpoB [Pirellulales bacterium]
MNRRGFLSIGLLLSGGVAAGCRGNQFAKVRAPGQSDMVGSHQAGAETFKPLVTEAVGQLLARHAPQAIPVGTVGPAPMRICFVAVENKSAEEIGDFKDQIYEVIDLHILNSHVFQPVNKRFIDAGLMQTRLRPDQLFVPANMRMFAAALEQQGQPIDCLLYATITSGTTHENRDYQRDYLLTLELIDVHSGQYDKQAATLSKGYYHSRTAKWLSNVGLKR